MPKSLVIVESPAKAKTIKKYLGNDFEVKSSMGHIKDLPIKELGVDVKNNFEPKYEVIKGKLSILKEIKKASEQAENIYLAPDPDREGEAIAWHIAEEIKSKNKNINRAIFYEITKNAVQNAIKNPQKLDENLYLAQKARRILDRLVGYKISPILCRTLNWRLSAGRVQSVAVRLICEREQQIKNFIPEEYWSIIARLEGGNPPQFEASLFKIDGKKLEIKNEAGAATIVQDLRGANFVVQNVEKKERRRYPTPPFITSTMQQEAARKINFNSKKTMQIAQGLYEGVKIGEEGLVGLITYMRTDSTRISNDAINEVRQFIKHAFGENYIPESPVFYKTKGKVQDAHEAIRPTSMNNTPDKIKKFLTPDQFKLYSIIWNRFVASQMNSAVYDQTTIDISAKDKYLFRATGSILKFDGFLKVYEEGIDETPEKDESEIIGSIPKLSEGENLKLLELKSNQHFTQPPARFSEPTLIKELESKGIGRPSTYATIVSTILEKDYVAKEKGRLIPTNLGMLVTDLLIKSFPEVLDVEFTAQMEDQLDKIAEGATNWVAVLQEFYKNFEGRLQESAVKMAEAAETNEVCDKCGAKMVIKSGRSGLFLACSAYPDCRNTKPLENGMGENEIIPEKDAVCDKCGAKMIIKGGRNGLFLACSAYPECRNTKPLEEGKSEEEQIPEQDSVCEKCGGKMVVKSGRKGRFLACSNYPDCKNTKPLNNHQIANLPPLVNKIEEYCKKCGAKMVIKSGRNGLFLACSAYPECRNTKPFKNGLVEEETISEQETICDKCGGKMVVKSGRKGRFLACSNYPDCKNTKPLNNHQMPNLPQLVNEINVFCNKCGAKMVVKMSRNGRFLACPNYPKCKNSKPLVVGVKCPNADCDGQIVEVFPKNGKMHYRCTNFPKCRIKLWNMPLNKACPKCKSPFLVVANELVKCINKTCDFKGELKDFIGR